MGFGGTQVGTQRSRLKEDIHKPVEYKHPIDDKILHLSLGCRQMLKTDSCHFYIKNKYT